MRLFTGLGLLLFGACFLAGCPATLSSLNSAGPAQAAPPPVGADQRTPVPYSISAVNRGAFTEFTIRNDGPVELPVHPEEIAMLVTSTRDQVHYDPHEVVVDLPPDGRVAPGQSVTGRIRFLKVPNPTGNRLVFNPGGDPRGRFAVVATIRGSQEAR